MAMPKEQLYTIDDIYALPERTRAELMDGQIYYMAPPNRQHQKILHFLDRIIGNYIAEKKGTCEIYPAPFAVFLNDDDINYVEPDISVICNSDKLNDKGCVGAPDFIVEIVSPGSKRMDYYLKLFKYRSAGVREYWIVDPLTQIVTVHFFEDENSPYQYLFASSIKVNIYGDLHIDFTQLKQ